MGYKLVCGGIALLLAYAVLAQPPADLDGDGRISLEEFEQGAVLEFKHLDRDADGYLSLEELRDARGQNAPNRHDFVGVDLDGDGALSLAELRIIRPDLTLQEFAVLDVDGDGVITVGERPRPPRRL